MKTLLLGAVLSVIITTTAAADKPYIAWGAGRSSCGAWTRNADGPNDTQYGAWVLGFVSSFNRYGLVEDADIAKGTDAHGIIAWVDAYCRQHPLDSIATATEHLINELITRTGAQHR